MVEVFLLLFIFASSFSCMHKKRLLMLGNGSGGNSGHALLVIKLLAHKKAIKVRENNV